MGLARRALGNTGLEVSLLGLGTVKIGRTAGLKYPTDPELPSDEAVRELLDRAKALGINLIDTAPAYGTSEERLGELLEGERREWLISTKVGEEFDGEASRYDFSPDAVRRSVARSLRRLRTDYLDIVLIHSDGNDREILEREGTLEALQTLKAEGVIRAVGMSHKTVAGGELAVARGADVLMATLTPSYRAEAALIEAAANAGCGILIKKALDSGRGTSADLATVIREPGVHCIVVGTTSTRHLEENAAAVAQNGAWH